MSLTLFTINFNGPRDHSKRELVFNIGFLQAKTIVFVYRRPIERGLILTNGKVNGKHKGVGIVPAYVNLVYP